MRIFLEAILLLCASVTQAQIGPGGGCTNNCTFTGLTTTAAASAGGTVSVSAGAGVTNSLTITNNGTITATVTPAAAASFGTSVTAPTLSGTTSVTSPLFKSTTTQSFQGQAASTDSATVTNNLWAFNGKLTVLGPGTQSIPSIVWPSGVGIYNAASGNRIDFEIGGATPYSFVDSGMFLSSNSIPIVMGSGNDTGISRCAANVVCFGNGTNADTTGSIKGVTTNSSAPAGSIGEVVTSTVASTGAVVTISSNTAITIVSTGATVTAGDYDVTGVVCYSSAAATSFTVFQQGVSTTTNVLGALGTSSSEQLAAMVPGTITLGTSTAEICKPVPRTRVSLSGTGTIFLVARPVFTVSANISGYGQIMIRRVR